MAQPSLPDRVRGRFTTLQEEFTVKIAPMFRAMAVACGLGALVAASQAQVIDAGQVSITVPEAGYALSSPREYGDYSDLLGNYSVVANGLKYNVAQQLSADSYSGSSEYGHLDVWFRGMFVADPGYTITGYKVTVNGQVSAYKTGTVSMQVSGAGAPAQASTVWEKMGSNMQSFSWTRTLTSTTDRPEIDLTAYASATYGVLCLPDDPWSCQYSQGSASILLSNMTIQALVATTVPAVPEAEGVWLALVGVAGLAVRRGHRRA